MSRLRLVPISIRDAKRYVARWHRHLEPCRGALFAIAASRGDLEPVGVAIIGRPNARLSQDGLTCEVLRVAAIEGERNVCSFLYSHARRAAQALGYRRGTTKTRVDESGASLRALGLRPDGTTRGREWDTPSRRRVRRGGHQLIDKINWTLWDERERAI
jgi:hypothetical protein